MNTESVKLSSKQIIHNLSENDYNIIYEMTELFSQLSKDRQSRELRNYLNDHNITSKEVYNWLLNNQNDSNAVYLLGIFNYLGIEVCVNKRKAFELYQKAVNLGNVFAMSSLGNFYKLGIGTSVNEQKAFELYQKAADLGNATGMNNLGICYEDGIGTNIDKQKAFELFQNAADLGNALGINNLAYCYEKGIGTNIDNQKAFELYQKATNLFQLYFLNL